MLIDTGACVSIINSAMFPHLRKYLKEDKPRLDSIVSVTGSIEPVEGMLTMGLQTPDGKAKFQFQFHFARLNAESVILGTD